VTVWSFLFSMTENMLQPEETPRVKKKRKPLERPLSTQKLEAMQKARESLRRKRLEAKMGIIPLAPTEAPVPWQTVAQPTAPLTQVPSNFMTALPGETLDEQIQRLASSLSEKDLNSAIEIVQEALSVLYAARSQFSAQHDARPPRTLQEQSQVHRAESERAQTGPGSRRGLDVDGPFGSWPLGPPDTLFSGLQQGWDFESLTPFGQNSQTY
jgi:hypothetical protein